MPQSLHVLSAHIIFSTKRRHPWLTPDVRERIWAYQSRILQNLGCSSITVGGTADHVHILCNFTKKFPTAKFSNFSKKIRRNLQRHSIQIFATFIGRTGTAFSA